MALQRALFVHNTDPSAWRRLQVNGMTSRFSWDDSALAYAQLYEWAIARLRGLAG